MTEITILIVVLVVAGGIGLFVQRRDGRARPTEAPVTDTRRTELLTAAGIGTAGPAVLHFSAEWCGPCAAVRRVVSGVTADLADRARPPRDIEIDIDAEPALARELNVLSLPTTFVFDTEGRERFRISGVPKTADLRSALDPLTVADQG
ncbi:thioredoxin family protein [Nocardia higoensis]|uniref:Thioredoxin family protein n=1 Tax=Nocardia higoensis TaxID=228599 RepID=A0ABS0DBW1_9NOCA|nr:thioredoxin family protein [Nocardia higoensis]MBF6355960.1 thioredoxin family protein [Nocardia higoensis]